MNASEFPKIDLYEEVAQQGQVPPLSLAYVADPMKLDEHVPVYILKLEHPEQESKYFYTHLHDAQTDRRDIRLEIDVVRGQRTAYETELQEVRQAYLSSEARNRALLARLATLETRMSRMEWQRQSAEDLAVAQMMRIHALEARAQTDTVEDAGSSWTEGVVGLSQWLEKMESVFYISGCTIENQGIPLMNASEFPKIDPYEEVAQQGQVPPLSPAYVADPMKLDEHVPVYILKLEHPEYHAPSDYDIQVEDQLHDASPTAESPRYIADSDSMGKDDDEDPEEDPNGEHEPEDEDTKEEEPSEGFDKTEPFEEDETTITPPLPKHRGARISIKPQTPMAPLGHRTAMISESSAAARAPRGRYDFVDTIVAGQSLDRSTGHDAQTIARATDRAKDVGYVRALHASEHRMLTSIEEVNLRIKFAVRGQRTAYETELQEVRQAYLSSEARNRALLARLETLETRMSRMEWQRQSAEDLAVAQMMRIHALEARARTDTVEDAGSSC
nr:hypothetical protein [Tanacetum cinerariifolium]